MRRRSTVLLLAVVWVMAVAVSAGSPASAEEPPVEVGWWSSNPAATSPDRGLAVSAGPNGTITLAALRAPIDGAAPESATLTLTEEGGVQQAGAQLKVCATPNAWTSGPKQSFDKAPKPECDRAGVPLSRKADGTWTADVRNVLSSPLAGDPSMPSLMIVPAGSGAVPLGFEVRFKPPRLEVTIVRPAASSSSSSTSSSDTFADFDSPEPSSGPASGPSSSTFAGTPRRSSSPTIAGPPLASFSPAQLSGTIEDAPTAQDSAATEVLAAAPEPVAVAPAQAQVASSTAPANGSRTVQALFFIVVATTVGVGVGFGHARFRPEGATS